MMRNTFRFILPDEVIGNYFSAKGSIKAKINKNSRLITFRLIGRILRFAILRQAWSLTY
jgi:hypothetical protein